MKPNIIVAGILDTKGEEIKFLAEQINALGGNATIMELSPGAEVGWADIGLSEILKEIDKTPEDLFKVDRHQAAAWVTEAAIKKAAVEKSFGTCTSNAFSLLLLTLIVLPSTLMLAPICASIISVWSLQVG